MKIKFLGIFTVSRRQFELIEAFFFVFFFSLTIFFFVYQFPEYVSDPYVLYHARFLKYAALIATFLTVIEYQYVVSKLINSQKEIIEQQNVQLKNQKEEILKQKEEIAAQRDLAQQQYELIAEQKKSIMDSLHYASTIQRAILPEYEDILRDLDYFIFYRPKEVVSGDFYWFYRRDNGRIIIAAADCTGHGVPGAFMSLLGITYLNDIMAKTADDVMPDEILNQLRERVIKAFHSTNGEEEPKDGMDIAIYILEPDLRTLHFAGANNPLYIVRRADLHTLPEESKQVRVRVEQNLALIDLRADKMPIGRFRNMRPFSRQTIKIYQDDLLYTFSDGIVDQFGGTYGKRFGSSNFKKLLLSIANLPISEQKQAIERAVDSWMQQNPDLKIEQVDDMLVVGVKIVR